MNALEEFDQILKFGYNSEKLGDIKPKLDSYLLSCPEEEKAKCQRNIDLAERLIAECKEVDKLRQQYNLFHDYVLENRKAEFVELEYIEPFGNSYGVYVKVGKYVMELVYKPMDDVEKNEVRAKFYLDVDGLYKSFMIRKENKPDEYNFIQNKRRDFYPTSVRWENWGDVVIKAIKAVEENPQRFLLMCEASCPYNNDGTHKFKFWKTKAKVEVSYDANTGIIQGVKNGETPSGTHVVGGNGSFRFYEKGDYVLKVTLDCLAGEKPIKHDCFIDVDTYMRQLKETKEWGRNLPYKKVNELLKEKVEVITYDMEKEPFERTFYPIGFDGNWITYLKDKLKNI